MQEPTSEGSGQINTYKSKLPEMWNTIDQDGMDSLGDLAAAFTFIDQQPRGTVLKAIQELPTDRFCSYLLAATRQLIPGTEKPQDEVKNTLKFAMNKQFALTADTSPEKRILVSEFYKYVTQDKNRIPFFVLGIKNVLPNLDVETQEAIGTDLINSLDTMTSSTMAQLLSHNTIVSAMLKQPAQRNSLIQAVGTHLRLTIDDSNKVKTTGFIAADSTDQQAQEELTGKMQNSDLANRYGNQMVWMEGFFDNMLNGTYGQMNPEDITNCLTVMDANYMALWPQQKVSLQSGTGLDFSMTNVQQTAEWKQNIAAILQKMRVKEFT
ncbi:hypothetical protein BH09PAT2_BH09PAT2_03810 [soil metagenome]